jgi:hypothetical protein
MDELVRKPRHRAFGPEIHNFTYRSFVSYLCFLLAVGLEIVVFDLKNTGSTPGLGKNSSGATGSSLASNPNAITLNLFQLAGFAFIMALSLAYTAMIRIEIRRWVVDDGGQIEARAGQTED